MLHLRFFVSAVLFVSLSAGIICGWGLVEIGNSLTGFHLLYSFDLREWEVLAAWSCVGFLLASAGGVTSGLALLARKPWSRGLLVGSIVFASVITAVDWLFAGVPLEILWVIATATAAIVSWWFLYRYASVTTAFVRGRR